MRRIYDSPAVRRDDENPFQPNDRDATVEPVAMRSVPAATLSKHLVPHSLRHRAISLDVSTPQRTYDFGSPIPVSITMRNVMPFPITIPTRSPQLWQWYVDDHPAGERISSNDAPSRPAEFSFGRGERKRFRRHWHQSFRVSRSEWEPATPGSYTISASINVSDPSSKGLRDEVVVQIKDA